MTDLRIQWHKLDCYCCFVADDEFDTEISCNKTEGSLCSNEKKIYFSDSQCYSLSDSAF